MDAGAPDDWLYNGPPVSAMPTTAPAPVAQSLLPSTPAPSPPPAPGGDISGGYHITKPPPPLPQESDQGLLARTAVAEGGPSPEGQTAIIRAMLQRQAVSGKPISELLAQPGQIQTYWNGKLQGVDPNSPAYQGALKIAQTATPSPGLDSWYSPSGIKAQGFGKPPFDPSTGTMIGGQMFGHGTGWGTQAAPAPAGTDDASWGKFVSTLGPQATAPGAGQPGSKAQFNFGPQMGAVSAAAVPTFQRILAERNNGDMNAMRNASFGSPQLPYYVTPGTAAPAYPGLHWVDANGMEHINPGGMVQKAELGLENLAQGAFGDLGASASRLTSGGIAVDNPLYAAIAQGQGGPGALDVARAAQQGFQREEQQYTARHLGDPTEPALRFTGQMGPSTLAAIAAPEIEAPGSALEGLAGMASRAGGKAATSALRGVAATSTQVGANPQESVGSQLAAGAIGGPVAEAAGSGVAGLKTLIQRTGVDPASIPPETLQIADKAINQYGIPLRASQIGGTVNRNLATTDSNLIATQYAKNNAQQIGAWNKGLVTQIGASDFASPTPAAMAAGRERTGQIYDDLASRYSITDTNGLLGRLNQIYQDARGAVPEHDLTPLLQQIENVKSVVQDGRISGAGYQGLTDTGSSLDRLAGSDGPVSGYARDFRDAIDSSMRENMTTADQARLDQANSQWKALKAIEPLANKAGVTGQIPPQQLLGRLSSNRYYKGNLAYTKTGDDPMTDLARIGALLKEPPQSGTAPRIIETLKRQAIPALIGGAAGGEAALGHPALQALANPQVAMQLGAGAVAAKGVQLAGDAFRNLRYGPGAGAALVGAQAPRSAMGSAFGNVAKSVEVPLSALAGVRLQNALAVGTPSQ